MVPIEDFSSKLSVCLGKRISFFLVIQSYQQLKDSYGESYQGILDYSGMTIYLKTTNSKTANEVSEQIGDKTMIVNSRNGTVLELNKQITESLDKERVIRYDDLMALEIGENVVVRPMHRKDLKGNPIKAYPIYNTEKTKMKFRYEYLQDTFTGSPSMRNVLVKNTHKDIILENIKANFAEIIPEIIAVKMDEMIEKRILEEIRYEEARKRLQGIRDDKEKAKKEEITDKARDEIRKKYEMLFNDEILSQITSKKNLKELKEYLEIIGYLSEYENIKNIVIKGSE